MTTQRDRINITKELGKDTSDPTIQRLKKFRKDFIMRDDIFLKDAGRSSYCEKDGQIKCEGLLAKGCQVHSLWPYKSKQDFDDLTAFELDHVISVAEIKAALQRIHLNDPGLTTLDEVALTKLVGGRENIVLVHKACHRIHPKCEKFALDIYLTEETRLKKDFEKKLKAKFILSYTNRSCSDVLAQSWPVITTGTNAFSLINNVVNLLSCKITLVSAVELHIIKRHICVSTAA